MGIVVITIFAVMFSRFVVMPARSLWQIKTQAVRKAIIIFGLILILLAFVYPPWKLYPIPVKEWRSLKLPITERIVHYDYGYLFTGPVLPFGYGSYSVDWDRLSLEILAIVLLLGILLLLTRKKQE
jgi:hypothetical protein